MQKKKKLNQAYRYNIRHRNKILLLQSHSRRL